MSLRTFFVSVAVAAAAVFGAAAEWADAGTVTFNTNVFNATDLPSVDYVVGPITMTVTAFSGVTPGLVNRTSNGLGVEPGAIDSVPVDNLVFTFSQSVKLVSIRFESISGGTSGDRINLLSGAYSQNIAQADMVLVSGGTYDFTLPGAAPSSLTSFKVTSLAALSGGSSSFNVMRIVIDDSVAAVPLPPAALSGIALLGGLALVRRLRRR